MGQQPSYDDFLRAKAAIAPRFGGMQVDEATLNPALKPHTRRMVSWGLQGGRRAWFASFGLHKTATQLETMRVLTETTGRPTLITAPLGVRREFMREAQERFRGSYALDLKFIRDSDQVDGPGIYLTNYESVREGKVQPDPFIGVSLDEAAILRGFGGTKTFREFMALFAGDDRRDQSNRIKTAGVPYRFVATATPSPNDYIELLSYAGFLDVMDIGQAKTRFFKRNSEKADKLTLHPHKEREFWLWVASWALFVTRPSDLDPAFSDEGYDLPPLDVRWHELPVDHLAGAAIEKSGQKRMFKDATADLSAAAREKRESLPARVEKLMEIRAEDPAAHRIIWHDLEAERAALEKAIPAVAYGHWLETKDGDQSALALYERHYSCYQYADGRERKLFCGPGEKTVLLSRCGRAALAWRKFIDGSGETGVNCAFFRNEGETLSSSLLLEAMAIAWRRWPGERLYTYVNADAVQSPNPGYCFKQAGWRFCGVTAGGLHILEALPGAPVPDVEPHRQLATVYGSQDLDQREELIGDFADGRVQEMGAKPVMLGSGTNLQRHCAWSVFLGIGFKFNDFIQAVHRLRRFGQTADSVRLDLIYTEAEREVRRSLERKWRQHEEMVQKMIGIIKEFGLSEVAMQQALVRALGVERVEASGPDYRCVHNDCVAETRSMPDASVQLIVTSIPFSTQYEYSPNYADFGHTDDDPHFWQQMGFLIPELLRVLEPGRICAIHVKDRIIPGGINGFGFQTLSTLHMDCVREFQRHGFAYLGMKTITTDVVRENNQTYRLGWSEQCKDGSRMGCGVPEYLLIFRRPPSDTSNGYADRPVKKAKKEWDPEAKNWKHELGYSRARWQIDAHGYMRSNGDRTLLPEELEGLDADQVYKVWKAYNLQQVYDFEHHVRIGEALEKKGRLPPTFMLLPPHSAHPDVWTDVARMMTINAEQARKGNEMHLCPLQYDIVDRAIAQYTEPGEWVYDPFGGLMTVPFRAVKLGRKGIGVELNKGYWLDGCKYVEAASREAGMPSLFDLLDADQPENQKLRRTA
ncbi:DNA methyltransferase [Paracoccus versutus]|uniref:site-specific DNA-methyltransferase (adenine-specific) n=1 Tax=Paracoccus versutus TaxID=34007 RepID=A0A3D9XJW6_PARVE|nr:DNA methyltransferase [Paracoccus versutus]REF69928.1 DNA methylase [Paracoccus versutus]